MKYWLILSWVLLASCASSPTQLKIRNLTARGQYQQALNVVESSSIKKKKRNEFLYLLETGQLYFLQDKFLEATRQWEKAREILKDYYKKKTVDKVLNTFVNNNYEDFQGEVFEQHQFFFQLSQAYIRLSQDPLINSKLRSQYLGSARAAVVDWDSFIKSLSRNKNIKFFYKESFLARFWGSLVHEMIGARNDLQIAYQLVKDALKIKQQNIDALKNYFLGPQTKELIGKSLIRLARKLGRRQDISKWEKKFSLKSSDIELHPKLVIIDSGIIARKKATRVPFSLGYSFNNPSVSLRSNLLGVGFSAFSDFSIGVLGLGYFPTNYERASYIHFNYQISGGAVDFELPIREERISKKTELNIKTNYAESISKLDYSISLSELSRAASDADYERNYFKSGLRAAWKYMSAIVAAYRVYRDSLSLNQKGRGHAVSTIARFRASTAFTLSSAIIRASERADTRHWSTLPSQLFFHELPSSKESTPIWINGQQIGEIHPKSQELEIFSFSYRDLAQN